jgi:hypothetical protein
MRPKSFGIIALAAVVAFVGVAAAVFGPATFANLGRPAGGQAGTLPPSPASIGTPTWHVSDTWTYGVNASSPEMAVRSPFAEGNLTATVVSADGSQYNVSVHGSFRIGGLGGPWDDGPGNASIMVVMHRFLENATVEGYTWYRASDLAIIKDVRTFTLQGSMWTEAGIFNASYMATVETTYHPALDVWAFPLNENETWNVSSNATIQAVTKWHFDGPNLTEYILRNVTVTKPVHLVLTSGATEDVVTPAGTFSAIPVRVGAHAFERDLHPDPGDVMSCAGDHHVMERHLGLVAWFSEKTKNVVKASVDVGGVRVQVALASYHVG